MPGISLSLKSKPENKWQKFKGAQWTNPLLSIFHFRYWPKTLKKTKFWSAILQSFWDFLICRWSLNHCASPPACQVSTGSKWIRDYMQIKKSQNDLRIALQNFVFLKFLASNEKWKMLMPYPCSHFYFDIKFGDRLYSKEKRRAWPVLFWI